MKYIFLAPALSWLILTFCFQRPLPTLSHIHLALTMFSNAVEYHSSSIDSIDMEKQALIKLDVVENEMDHHVQYSSNSYFHASY
jgi:hypothetical protein